VSLINIYLRGFEALYEDYAQKGFGVSIIDGSPFPRAQQPPMDQKHSNTNKLISITINDHRGTSGL
jgi:hypothetical protein